MWNIRVLYDPIVSLLGGTQEKYMCLYSKMVKRISIVALSIIAKTHKQFSKRIDQQKNRKMNCITLIQLNTIQQKMKWPSLQLFISRWKNKTTVVLNDREGNGTHSSILAWRMPWMEEPGRLQSMGSLSCFGEGNGYPLQYSCLEPSGLPSMGLHRVRHDWSDLAAAVLNEQINLGLKVHTAISIQHSQKLSDGCCGAVKQM